MKLGDHISDCRQAYVAFQQLASRTDAALYHALSVVHALCFRMKADNALRCELAAMLKQHTGDNPVNQTLFLVKYAFFPHTLRPGPGHKADITKASRYAKLINWALSEHIPPEEFVDFARAHGIQRTAAGSRMLRSGLAHRGRPQRRTHLSISSYSRSALSFVGAVLEPLEPWLSSAELAGRLTSLLAQAQHGPQKIRLLLYVDQHRAVVTGCDAKPWVGPLPQAAIRVPKLNPVSCSPGSAGRETSPKSALRGSGLPVRRRGVSISPALRN
jgi:hypothetical protein